MVMLRSRPHEELGLVDMNLGQSHSPKTFSRAELQEGINEMHWYIERVLKDRTGGYYHAGIKPDNGLKHGGSFDYLFGRDTLIFGWQLIDSNFNVRYTKRNPKTDIEEIVTGNINGLDIARHTLETLAEVKGRVVGPNGQEPGKIIHEKPTTPKPGINWLEPGERYYFSVDSTPLFGMLFLEYYKRTHDPSLKQDVIDTVRWMLDYGIKDGFLRYDKPENGKGLQSQAWKDGIGNIMDNMGGPVAVVEVQGYAYAVLSSKVLRDLVAKEDPELANRMTQTSSKLKERFNKEFWSPEDNFYNLAIDGDNNKVMKITSNPGHLLVTGILDKKHADAVVGRLLKPDMFTQYGIRTQSTLDPDFDQYGYQRGSVWPHDNWIIAMGMKRMGYVSEYGIVRDAVLNSLFDLHSAPEYVPVGLDGKAIAFDEPKLISPPCMPQLWAAGADLYFLLEKMHEINLREKLWGSLLEA